MSEDEEVVEVMAEAVRARLAPLIDELIGEGKPTVGPIMLSQAMMALAIEILLQVVTQEDAASILRVLAEEVGKMDMNGEAVQ